MHDFTDDILDQSFYVWKAVDSDSAGRRTVFYRSQPVSSSIRFASSGLKRSPEPKTGTLPSTNCTSSFNLFQSEKPS